MLVSVVSTWWMTLPFIVLFVLYIRLVKEIKTKVRPSRRGIDRSLTYARQYPCGWYRICDSDDISKRGDVKHAFALGREMVIFRSDDEHQQVYVLDAFCVHMGANLAVGGRVVPGTNCLQCPFHLWEFNGQDGRCTKIPYMDGKTPEKVMKSFG
jgi:nitrite reductase/ring-hydroxylating ferredoxin subunit